MSRFQKINAMKLHEAIQIVLQNGPMTASEIASEINRRGLYHRKKDEALLKRNQISARIHRKTYKHLFFKLEDGRYSLRHP